MIDLLIDQWVYPSAQPQSLGSVSLLAVLRYNRRGEIVVEEPRHEANPFAELTTRGPRACSQASVAGARAWRGSVAGIESP